MFKRMSSALLGSFSVPWSDNDAPDLNAQRFEELVVTEVWENPLTDSSTRAPVRPVDEKMDDIVREWHWRLETMEPELMVVKYRLERLYRLTGSGLEQGLPVPAGWPQAQTHLSAIALP